MAKMEHDANAYARKMMEPLAMPRGESMKGKVMAEPFPTEKRMSGKMDNKRSKTRESGEGY